MEMQPVISSHVEAIGYAPEYNLMRVRFKDGAQYDYPNVSAEMHAAILKAPSIGVAIKPLKGVRLGEQPVKLREPAPPVLSKDPGRLNTFEPDDCCVTPLSKAAFSGALDGLASWTCPKCGTEWNRTIEHRMAAQSVIHHWSPHAPVEVFRP